MTKPKQKGCLMKRQRKSNTVKRIFSIMTEFAIALALAVALISAVIGASIQEQDKLACMVVQEVAK